MWFHQYSFELILIKVTISGMRKFVKNDDINTIIS